MRVNGEWLLCDDGIIRPSVSGLVRALDDQWVEVTFLLDCGADRTVFSSRFLHRLRGLEVGEGQQVYLAGVGGRVGSITVETTIGLIRDDERIVQVHGHFGVFTESESGDLSVLGRDVTNNFSAIYDYLNQAVTLLALPHHYEIKP
ncbi:MAG: hypothetical protein HY231_21555 [Acidobacteria bacterium]|nr:hypothetical protein [Acidobacteriota bacterium]